jgi:putative resolvase
LRERGVQEVITDIGSGLNEKRKGFLRLLDRVLHNEVDKVVILYEDRLTRFGFDTLRRVFEAHGTGIDVLNQVEMRSPQQELVERSYHDNLPLLRQNVWVKEPQA